MGFVQGGDSHRKIPKFLEPFWWEGKQGVCKGYHRDSSCTKVL